MAAVGKLAVANFLNRKIRTALTVAAIALSVSLVVSVTSGYASVEAAVYKFLNQYLGTTDVEVMLTNDAAVGVPDELVEQIRNDPEVRVADGRYEMGNNIATAKGKPLNKRVAVIGVKRPDDMRSDYLRLNAGGWFDSDDGDVAVIDQAVADALKAKLGDTFSLPGVNKKQLKLKIIGVVHKPALLAAYMQTIYVPIKTVQRFAGKEGRISRVMIDLNTSVDADKFAERWKPRLQAVDPNLNVRTARDTREQMDKNLEGINALSYLGGTVSMLAATFIVFSALSMGVAERQRTLAMLRAVGAYRWQIGRLVILEGLLLATAGVAVGVPLGWLWIKMLSLYYHDIFVAGVVPSWGGIIFGSLGSVLAALAASFLPAWSATRVDPLEAMSPQAAPEAKGPPWRLAPWGLVLIAIDPFLFFGPVERIITALGVSDPDARLREFQFYAHFAVGLPAVMVGFFLLAPMFVWLTERLLGPIVAAMWGLRYAMLRQQLSGGLWRAAGTAAALMVGLAVLVVMQTNGQTMLNGWKLPDKFPDIFIMTSITAGLDEKEQKQLAAVEGIKKNELMPIGLASPGLGSGFFALARMAIMPDATMFIAVDPHLAFKMMELEFREGNPLDAERMLADGRKVTLNDGTVIHGLVEKKTEPQGADVYDITTWNSEVRRVPAADVKSVEDWQYLVVTEEFRQLKGLGVGSSMELKATGGKMKEFTIAGVVWSPGIDVMVSMYDLNRQFDQRTAASVFGSLDDGREYFGVDRVFLFAANLENYVEKEKLLKNIQKKLGGQGMSVGDVRHIKHNIITSFRKLLMLASTVAFAALAVASLGVTNTIMASVRSRQWQFGVLRSIGVTRSQLLRVVLAEAMLLGLVGVGLGLAAGFEMTVNANRLSARITGYNPPISVPWGIIWAGVGVVVAISLLASLWPAASVARREPLSLLQAGRASA